MVPLFLCLSLSLPSPHPPFSFSFFHPNSCCLCTQLQRASVSPRCAAIGQPGKGRTNRQVLRIKCTCGDPNTRTFFLSQMFANKKTQEILFPPHANSPGTRGRDSLNLKLKTSRLIYVPVHLSISHDHFCPLALNVYGRAGPRPPTDPQRETRVGQKKENLKANRDGTSVEPSSQPK